MTPRCTATQGHVVCEHPPHPPTILHAGRDTQGHWHTWGTLNPRYPHIDDIVLFSLYSILVGVILIGIATVLAYG